VKQPIFLSIQKSPNNSYKLFGSYLPQIWKNIIAHVSHHAQLIPFLFCPEWQFVKKVPFIFDLFNPNFLDIFFCPNNFLMPKLKSICIVNIPEQIFKVPV